jgi:hypothetical protein
MNTNQKSIKKKFGILVFISTLNDIITLCDSERQLLQYEKHFHIALKGTSYGASTFRKSTLIRPVTCIIFNRNPVTRAPTIR